jgi:hypothetical protein
MARLKVVGLEQKELANATLYTPAATIRYR